MACYKKIILVSLLFIILINSFCFATDGSYSFTYDNYYTILEEYQKYIDKLVLSYNVSYNESASLKARWDSFFKFVKEGGYFYINTDSNSPRWNIIYTYSYNTSYTVVDDSSISYTSDFSVPTSIVNITTNRKYSIDETTKRLLDTSGSSTLFIPLCLFKKIPIEFVELMERSGYSYNGDTSLLIDIKNELSNMNNKMDTLNESITDSSVDSSSSDLPQFTYNDTTKSGVDNLFQNISDKVTTISPSGAGINLPIPFVNKNIFISASLTRDILNSWSNLYGDMSDDNGAIRNVDFSSFIYNIIVAFWYYFISRYIILDIMKKIRKIQVGDIENLENENIKGDML